MFSFELNEESDDREDVDTVSRADDLKLDIELKELRDVDDVEESIPGFAVEEFVVDDAEVGDEDDDDDTNDDENIEDDEDDEKSLGKILFVSVDIDGFFVLLLVAVVIPKLVSTLI